MVVVVGSAVTSRMTHHASRRAPHKIAADEHVKTKSADARDAYRGAFTALHDAQLFEADVEDQVQAAPDETRMT